MKIVVNGDLIDLDLVYKITDIEIDERNYTFEFYICFLNNNSKCIYVDSGCDYYSVVLPEQNIDYGSLSYYDYEQEKYVKQEVASNLTIENIKQISTYKRRLQEITDLRNEIVKVWSSKQDKFPTFNIERRLK